MKLILKLVFALATAAIFAADSYCCTSAIISASLNPSGRPILWKHRDTSDIHNKIEYIAPKKGKFGYVALFNADDKKLEQAWMGMNDAGFAVMNTASYNIKDDNVPQKKMDKEGFLMTKALTTCRTVDDFERLLADYPRPMGVEANFGVIDATGEGAYFETNNDSWVRFNLSDSPSGALVRTNYSHSGREGEGYGHVREANAIDLLAPYIDEHNVTPEVLTETISRSFYHSASHNDYTLMGLEKDFMVEDVDFIPRYKSTATVAIEGCVPVDNAGDVDANFVKNEYVMWSGLGYPPVAYIYDVRCDADGVAPGLRGDASGKSPICEEAISLRDKVFTFSLDRKKVYVNLHLLRNEDGTGYAQQAINANKITYQLHQRERDGK